MNRRAIVIDMVVALAAFAASAGILSGAGARDATGFRDADLLGYLLLAVYSASAALRRPYPVAAVAAGLGAGVAYSAANYPVALNPAPLLALYTAGSVLSERKSRWLLALSVLVSAFGATVTPGPTNVAVPLVVAGAWFLGHSVRADRLYTQELEAKNRQLEQARHELARQAVTEERLRIARELHDVVAHTMSVVAVHAGSGRMVAAADPAAAERALKIIETTTRSALGEMRRLLGVLRSRDGQEPGTLAPAPGLDDVPSLVAEVVRSGLHVELRVEGERPAVPPGVDLSAYRVVQEALTNVIKHAGPAKAAVDVRYSPTDVVVEVVDDGSGVAPTEPKGGHGLVGMRERVAVHGGVLEAGPRPGGGFRVAARFPVGEG
ncbi:MAG: histidine kinase [Actinomycetota bacterium]|nr:histidine kinase [Actinomycetota bacterium]